MRSPPVIILTRRRKSRGDGWIAPLNNQTFKWHRIIIVLSREFQQISNQFRFLSVFFETPYIFRSLWYLFSPAKIGFSNVFSSIYVILISVRYRASPTGTYSPSYISQYTRWRGRCIDSVSSLKFVHRITSQPIITREESKSDFLALEGRWAG